MFEKYKFIKKFRLHQACYLMVDVEPPPDEYDLPSGKLSQPNFLWLKRKPVLLAVDAFLKNFILIFWSSTPGAVEFNEIMVKIQGQKTGINKDNLSTGGHVLAHVFTQLNDDPAFQADPNGFYPIELTRHDLCVIAGVMGLKPAFLANETASAPIEEKKTPVEILPIHTAQNVTWKHIFMTVRNYEMTEIKFSGEVENRRHADMGLKEVAGKPGIVLMQFLILAINSGELKPTTGTDDIKHTISRLRKTLRALFPDISGEPIPYIKGQWQTVFRLTADPENLFETMPDGTKEKIFPHLQNQ
ncbi:MAG: hypothetical protein WA081_05400 [Desulfosalsimonadaceae bacterium]